MIFKKHTKICILFGLLLLALPFSLKSCKKGRQKEPNEQENALTLPVIKIDTTSAITVKDYIGTIEGKVNVEIRPQVEGLLEEIYVDEGDYVKQGQALFKISPLPYQEVLNDALATENVEKAKLKNAQLEIDRLKPLIENEVIAGVQLETAKSNYEVAKASLARASSAVASAKINMEFTVIKAPVSGYIGRLPKRIGNLVTKGETQPLTVLTDISDVYVYFSISESDYLYFTKNKLQQNDRENSEKGGKLMSDVQLILADGTEYSEKGYVDAINGQVDRSTGSIALRASFPNSQDLMRSGNTGTIKLKESKSNVILVPQQATTTIQDKTFVYILDEQSRVKFQMIEIQDVSGQNYIVSSGLKPGDLVIKTGLNKLAEGDIVKPQF